MMAARIASGSGESPTKILRTWSAWDVSLLTALDRRHPFGEWGVQYLLAQLTALLYNQKRREHSQPSKTTDWLPWYLPPEQTDDEVFEILRSAGSGNRGKH